MEPAWSSQGRDADSDGEQDHPLILLPDGREICCRCLSRMKAHEESDGSPLSIILHPPFDIDRPKLHDMPEHFPAEFRPPVPGSTPDTVFEPVRTHGANTRYVYRGDPRTALIFTDGACPDNGRAEPRAGWAFDLGPRLRPFGPRNYTVSGRLEAKGPTGVPAPQTNNRAEIRAAIAALRFWFWPGEGIRTLVIATDSEHLAKGATTWARKWAQNGWRTATKRPVANRDLWEFLLKEVKKLAWCGTEVEFWWIPRAQNAVADVAARDAAKGPDVAEHTDTYGLHV